MPETSAPFLFDQDHSRFNVLNLWMGCMAPRVCSRTGRLLRTRLSQENPAGWTYPRDRLSANELREFRIPAFVQKVATMPVVGSRNLVRDDK